MLTSIGSAMKRKKTIAGKPKLLKYQRNFVVFWYWMKCMYNNRRNMASPRKGAVQRPLLTLFDIYTKAVKYSKIFNGFVYTMSQ